MLGKKRRNDSLSSNSDANPFQFKKVTPESPPFGNQATATTELKLAASPSVDRRKAARQHVRALNTEFASWVQSQLHNHGDELWEDGVSAYLTHASGIMDKFSDVVNWLKTNGGNDGSMPTAEAENIQKTNGPETISKETTVPVKSLFGMTGNNIGVTSSTSTGFTSTPTFSHGSEFYSAPSWSFGLSSSSQALSQSSTAGHATSWNPVTFSNSKSVSPAKEVGSSTVSSLGISSSNQTSPVLASSPGIFSAGSTTPGLFSTSSTTSGFVSTSSATSFSTAPSFSAPWSAGAFANSQATFNFGGNHTSAPTTIATEGADEDDEPEQPSSPSLKKSEEEGITVVHETKCKLFVKSTDPADKEPWKDKGVGQLFIKCEEGASKGTKESKPRILVRNDVGRIMLNASLYSGIKTNLQKNAIVAIFHTLDGSAGDAGSVKAVARTFLIRVKNEEERNKLADAIREHAPAA